MKNFNGEKIFSLEYDKETLRDMVIDLQNQLQQEENIIKEVREYTSKTQMPEGYKKMILEILDKE